MKKALIIVQNNQSTTRKYGEEIAAFLLNRGLSTELVPINSFEPKNLENTDYLLLSGGRNDSNGEWESFVKKLPSLNGIKTALFTTYKFLGSGIFRKMKKYLRDKAEDPEIALKSRDGSLSIDDKLALNEFIK